MDYYLIKGLFHVVGYSPDGDSLMFEADNAKHWEKLQSQYQDIFNEKLKEGDGSVQLRLQGIDALETHYRAAPVPPPAEVRGKKYSKAEKPSAVNYRQPAGYGDASTEKLLSYLGVTSTEWGSGFGRHWIKEITVKKGRKNHTFSQKGKDELEGYIVTNDFDRKGRPIAWVFPGKTRSRTGAKLTDAKLANILKKSINYRLVATGLVYPYFFMTLSARLRQPLMNGVLNAQRQKMNLWSEDQSQKGITLDRFSSLTDDQLLFPYLFRRLVKHQFRRQMEGYWEAVQNKKKFEADPEAVFLDSFFDDTNPYVFLIDERDFVRLDSIVAISRNKLKLKTHPGNIVFLS